MTGAITWEQLAAIAAIVTAFGGFAGWFVLSATRQLAQNRHDMRSHVDQVAITFEEKLEDLTGDLTKRVTQLELFNAGLIAVLKQMEEFRADVNDRFDKLTSDRRDDMRGLHLRLDAVIHGQRVASGQAEP